MLIQSSIERTIPFWTAATSAAIVAGVNVINKPVISKKVFILFLFVNF